ncbi:MAG: phytoene/squalene synthetase [Micavibrio sp.]|nr:phytoene/squalene synthetase [Micavibrio sp.]|tara:strand:- start:1681 stop:2496 length:816 start_codon:yes stop_codon:yes gene_type:complete
MHKNIKENNTDYCRNLIKTHDPDRYAVSLFAPAKSHAALWALYAFQHEIAKTREIVTETQLGLIRLQWWREEIEKACRGEVVKEHQVLTPFVEAIQSHDLPVALFETVLYAREFDLEDVQPENLDGLIHYARYTNQPLLELTQMICGQDIDSNACEHLGIAYGLIGITRNTLGFARQRRCYLPSEMTKEAGIKMSKLYEGHPQEGLSAIIKVIVTEADRHLDIARQSGLSHPLRALAKLTGLYTRHMKECKFDPFHKAFMDEPHFKLVRLI